MQLCFFTDKIASNFLPLTLTRPVDDLRVGILTIREKWVKLLKATSVIRILAPHLRGVFEQGSMAADTPTLWLNSRYLPSHEVLQMLQQLKLNESIWDDDVPVAALIEPDLSQKNLDENTFDFKGLKRIPHALTFKKLRYFWDLLALNADQIKADISFFNYTPFPQSQFASSCVSQNPEHIYIADSATIEPGCILLANEGPIVIGAHAVIEAGSILRGPVAVCEKAVVKMGARIFSGTTIGPVCKVGGEVNNTIFHSYSNKAHDGFIGNSILGQWCNLGAGTNTSNLKNNYRHVQLSHWETEEPMGQGVQFFGTVMGDHSKTAINTSLNTGTVIGVSSNIFSGKFPPKLVRSFTWLGEGEATLYRFDQALETMKAVMQRRGITIDKAYAAMMRQLYPNP